MFSELLGELKALRVTIGQVLKSREFWIYSGIILVFVLMAVAGIRLATGFDPVTRMQLRMGFSCRSGEGQLATIIIGCFVFGVACVFTLGEVINWVEATRNSRVPGRRHYKVGHWRPILHVLGTILLGVSGYLLLQTWCT